MTEDEILQAYRDPIRAWDLGDGFTMIIGANQQVVQLIIEDPSGLRRGLTIQLAALEPVD